MWVRSLGREDPLKEGMTTHSSVLAWRIPWTLGEARPGQSSLSARALRYRLPFPAWRISVDRGAWWATVHVKLLQFS